MLSEWVAFTASGARLPVNYLRLVEILVIKGLQRLSKHPAADPRTQTPVRTQARLGFDLSKTKGLAAAHAWQKYINIGVRRRNSDNA